MHQKDNLLDKTIASVNDALEALAISIKERKMDLNNCCGADDDRERRCADPASRAKCTEEVWKEYHDKLHGFIRSRVGDSATADDILQEVFVRIHSRINTLKDSSKIQSWVYQITRNAIIDHYRTHKKSTELPDSLSAIEKESSSNALQEIEQCIQPMIQRLPEHYREALVLSELEGLTQKDVAKKQDISLSGAKSRIQRGRAMMKDMLFDCCNFEFDHQGNVVDSNCDNCDCDEPRTFFKKSASFPHHLRLYGQKEGEQDAPSERCRPGTEKG